MFTNVVFVDKIHQNLSKGETIMHLLSPSGLLSAGMDVQGGGLTTLQYLATHILYPHQRLREENVYHYRGGDLFTFPYFGAQGNLPRHGFLRDAILPTVRNHRSNAGQMMLPLSGDMLSFPYTGMVSSWASVSDSGVTRKLWVKNTGVSEMPLNVGYHPYLNMLNGMAQVYSGSYGLAVGMGACDGFAWGVPRLLDVVEDACVLCVVPGLGEIKMSYPKEIKHLVVWTNHPNYFCVSPVMGTVETYGTQDGYFLAPGAELSLQFDITFTPEPKE